MRSRRQSTLVYCIQTLHRLAMRTSRSKIEDPTGWWLPVPLLLIFLVVPVAIELTLMAADYGFFATPRLRHTAYQYGAFWAGLLGNWRPNYAAQPWLMFFTYSFLHAGFLHIAGNMTSLVYLMQLNARNLRGWPFFFLYLISALGGALGFTLLGTAFNPMVGASGALFGLTGAWRYQDWIAEPDLNRRASIILRDCFLLALLNLLMWYLEDGALAWESHLGGFVTGVATMAVMNRFRSRKTSNQ